MRNGSPSAADFEQAQLLSGPQGPRGPEGEKGDLNSSPANGLGVPVVAYSSLVGQCADTEIEVRTYRASPAIALSSSTSFAIVVP